MRRFGALDWTVITLTIIGALNWGLVGLFNFNLVEAIFGSFTLVTRIIYTIIAICGLYLIYTTSKIGNRVEDVD